MVSKVGTAQAVEKKRVPITLLDPDPHNYNDHPPQQIAELAASLALFGQIKPIVVRASANKRYTIKAGHGLMLAVSHLLTREPIKYAHLTTVDVVVVPPDWDDTKATGYMIADNETARKAAADDDRLTALLKEQQQAGTDLLALGFSAEDLRQRLEAMVHSFETTLDPDDDELTPRETLGRTPEEKLDGYNFGSIRQIVLLLDPDQYATVLDQFKHIRERHAELETNTDVVMHLLDSYVPRKGVA